MRCHSLAALVILIASAFWGWNLAEARVLSPYLPILRRINLSLPSRNAKRSSEISSIRKPSSISGPFESPLVQSFIFDNTDFTNIGNLHDTFVNVYTQQLYTKLNGTDPVLPPHFIPLSVYGAFETGSINYYCPSPVFYIIKVCPVCPIVPVHSENNTVVSPPSLPQISSHPATYSTNNATATGTRSFPATSATLSINRNASLTTYPFTDYSSSTLLYSTIYSHPPITTVLSAPTSYSSQPFYPNNTAIRFTNHSTIFRPTQYSSSTYASSVFFPRPSQTTPYPNSTAISVESHPTLTSTSGEVTITPTFQSTPSSEAYVFTTASPTTFGLVSIGSMLTSRSLITTFTGPPSIPSSPTVIITSPPLAVETLPAPVQIVVPPVISVVVSAPPCISNFPATAANVTYIAIICNACSGTPPAACPTVTIVSTQLVSYPSVPLSTAVSPSLPLATTNGTSSSHSLASLSTSGIYLVSILSTSTPEGHLPSYTPGPKHTYTFYNSTTSSTSTISSEVTQSSSTETPSSTAPATTVTTPRTTASTPQTPSTTFEYAPATTISTIFQPCPV